MLKRRILITIISAVLILTRFLPPLLIHPYYPPLSLIANVDGVIFSPAMEQELSEALAKVDDNDVSGDKMRRQSSSGEPYLCCQRTISDLAQFLDRAKVGKFIDLSPNTNCIDVNTHKMAWRIRNDIRARLGNDAIFHESVSWNDPDGIDAHAHSDYLERMCDSFYNRTRELIDRQMSLRVVSVTDPFYEDIVQNWHIAREHCSGFIGRDSLLQQIRRYIVSDTSQSLVVHGDAGTGG